MLISQLLERLEHKHIVNHHIEEIIELTLNINVKGLVDEAKVIACNAEIFSSIIFRNW